MTDKAESRKREIVRSLLLVNTAKYHLPLKTTAEKALNAIYRDLPAQ